MHNTRYSLRYKRSLLFLLCCHSTAVSATHPGIVQKHWLQYHWKPVAGSVEERSAQFKPDQKNTVKKDMYTFWGKTGRVSDKFSTHSRTLQDRWMKIGRELNVSWTTVKELPLVMHCCRSIPKWETLITWILLSQNESQEEKKWNLMNKKNCAAKSKRINANSLPVGKTTCVLKHVAMRLPISGCLCCCSTHCLMHQSFSHLLYITCT